METKRAMGRVARQIDGQDGVVGRLSRRIQHPSGVQEAFYQVVVNEELAGGANVN